MSYGIVGSQSLLLKVFGSSVNIASRMAANSVPSRILLSDTAASGLAHPSHFQLQDRGEISVKGRGYMHTYWLLGPAGRTYPSVLPPPPGSRTSPPPPANHSPSSPPPPFSNSTEKKSQQTNERNDKEDGSVKTMLPPFTSSPPPSLILPKPDHSLCPDSCNASTHPFPPNTLCPETADFSDAMDSPFSCEHLFLGPDSLRLRSSPSPVLSPSSPLVTPAPLIGAEEEIDRPAFLTAPKIEAGIHPFTLKYVPLKRCRGLHSVAVMGSSPLSQAAPFHGTVPASPHRAPQQQLTIPQLEKQYLDKEQLSALRFQTYVLSFVLVIFVWLAINNRNHPSLIGYSLFQTAQIVLLLALLRHPVYTFTLFRPCFAAFLVTQCFGLSVISYMFETTEKLTKAEYVVTHASLLFLSLPRYCLGFSFLFPSILLILACSGWEREPELAESFASIWGHSPVCTAFGICFGMLAHTAEANCPSSAKTKPS
eukprot:GCRY01003087.1.p1 GENE.GCRY01003087.1~~GCRY01003087.1.p1  ORF type:complete len:481 (+),score=107.20 GCRY01003087.1:1738-3180(+)